jgi:hypothetical protein
MNAFYSLVSIGGLLERRQIKVRPTILNEDQTIAASGESKAPLTLTRLIVARGPLTEQRIAISLAFLTLTSSVLAVLTLLLIPFLPDVIIVWPFSLVLVIVPILLILGIYLTLRKINHLGLRLAGLVAIMVGVWGLGMVGFALLDFLINVYQSIFWPVVGILFILGWLALWHFSTRLYFRYEMKRSTYLKPVDS